MGDGPGLSGEILQPSLNPLQQDLKPIIEKLDTFIPKETPHDAGRKGISELSALAADSSFQEGFIQVQIGPARERVSAINAAIEGQLKSEIDRLTAEKLGFDQRQIQENPRERGALWSQTRLQISQGSEVSEKRKQLQEADVNLAKAQADLLQSEVRQRELIATMQEELVARKDDPELLAAMETWGQSPDSKGERGQDGTGFNAGVIHYFEYRADANKNGRYKFSDTEISLKGFIDYSKKIKAIIDNPATNSEVQTYGIIEDDSGQRRLFILTKDGNKIVGFMRKDEPMRVITVIPGADEEAIQKDIQLELTTDQNDPKEAKRLNRLGSGRKQISS